MGIYSTFVHTIFLEKPLKTRLAFAAERERR